MITLSFDVLFMFMPDLQAEIGDCICEEVGIDYISYILKCTKSFEAGVIDTTTMVGNLSVAIMLQYLVMELCGVEFHKESAASLNNSESCSAIKKLAFNLCFVHFKGM